MSPEQNNNAMSPNVALQVRKDIPKIIFYSDKRKFSGPRVDGGCTVSFDVGEDQRSFAAQTLFLGDDVVVKVTVEVVE